jgi:hypothetical protein
LLESIIAGANSMEFRTGFVIGLLTLVVGFITGRLWQRFWGIPAPVLGALWAVGVIVAFSVVAQWDPVMIAGLGLLAVAGILFDSFHRVPWMRVLAAGPGAWLVTRQYAESQLSGSILWVMLAIVMIAAPLTVSSDRKLVPAGLGVLLWGITLGGVYGTLPDTEDALVMVGVVAPLAFLAPFNLGRLGAIGGYTSVGLLVWVTGQGGVGRPASIIGALACLGVFLLIPAVRLVGKSPGWRELSLVHLAAVFSSSRVAGLRTDLLEAAGIALVTLAVSYFALLLFSPKPDPVMALDSRATPS